MSKLTHDEILPLCDYESLTKHIDRFKRIVVDVFELVTEYREKVEMLSSSDAKSDSVFEDEEGGSDSTFVAMVSEIVQLWAQTRMLYSIPTLKRFLNLNPEANMIENEESKTVVEMIDHIRDFVLELRKEDWAQDLEKHELRVTEESKPFGTKTTERDPQSSA